MNKSTRVCIVIPVYKAEIKPEEQVALQQCFKILGHYAIYFAVPAHLESWIKQNPYCISGQAAYKIFSDDYFTGIPAYNRLLKSPVFYKTFLAYDYLLIHQLDAFVFKDDLNYWCDEGYLTIGAPIFEGHDFSTASSPINGQGNGGFCLRNVKACYQVVTSLRKLNYKKEYSDDSRSVFRNLYRYVKHELLHNYSLYPFQPIINEDLFWSVLVPAAFPEFKVPDPMVSVGFSFEMHPEVLFEINKEQLPFGCHAWLKYNFAFWQPHMQKLGYQL
jgi:hypothetical protein